MPLKIKSYEQALEFLYRRINFERAGAGSYTKRDFKLDRMRRFLSLVGDPQDRIPAVHVAGTKGKGSTAAMIASVLQAAGHRVGLFTSPHVSAFEERMTVDGAVPTRQQIVELLNALLDAVQTLDALPGRFSPTFFEIATAMAWLHFERSGTQLAVMEVGMGGRLDSTNICNSEVSLITNISRDHTEFLGDSLALIAREKAGIIKPRVPVLSGVTQSSPGKVVQRVCREKDSPLYRLGEDFRYQYRPVLDSSPQQPDRDGQVVRSLVGVETPGGNRYSLSLPLAGEHQAANAALAVSAVELLSQRGWSVPRDAIQNGMSAVACPLRIEFLSERPTVLVDAAHNIASAEVLAKSLQERKPAGRRILVFAGTTNKDIEGMLRRLLPEFDTVVLTRYLTNPRAVPVEQLQSIVLSLADVPVHAAPEPAAAWKLVSQLSKPADLICVTGSFFIAAEMRELIVEDFPQSGASQPVGGAAVAG